MITVHKFPLTNQEYTELEIPENAEILCVQVQYEKPCLWALVNTDYSLEKRAIRIVGTGHEINPCEPLIYIDTYQLPGLVFHVFEIPTHKII